MQHSCHKAMVHSISVVLFELKASIYAGPAGRGPSYPYEVPLKPLVTGTRTANSSPQGSPYALQRSWTPTIGSPTAPNMAAPSKAASLKALLSSLSATGTSQQHPSECFMLHASCRPVAEQLLTIRQQHAATPTCLRFFGSIKSMDASKDANGSCSTVSPTDAAYLEPASSA